MVTIIRDLVYVEQNAHERHNLDLYLPSNANQHPLIMWVHGGSWIKGDKTEMPLLSFVSDGIAVASINYRFLNDAATITAPICDVKSAIRFLRKIAEQYDLDMDRFIGAGFSAGAHLVALATLTGDSVTFSNDNDDELENGDYSAQLRAAAVFGGIYDLSKLTPRPESGLDYVLKDKNAAEFMVYASPVTYITPQSPPFFIQHGAEDDTVDYRQSLLFADALKHHGVTHTLDIVPRLNHKMKLDVPMKDALYDLLR